MQMIDRNPAPEDRQQLQREGYLLAPGLVNMAGVERLLQWTTELETGPEVTGRHWIYREESLTAPGDRIVQRLENFCPFHEAFDGFVREGALPAWISALLGGPAVLFKDKINFKMPGGAGFKLHQDQQAGWSHYAPLFVTAMISLDAAPVASGCLEIAAGRHREGLIGTEWQPLDEMGDRPDGRAHRTRGCDLLRQLRAARFQGQPVGPVRDASCTSPTISRATAITAPGTSPTSTRPFRPISTAIRPNPTSSVSRITDRLRLGALLGTVAGLALVVWLLHSYGVVRIAGVLARAGVLGTLAVLGRAPAADVLLDTGLAGGGGTRRPVRGRRCTRCFGCAGSAKRSTICCRWLRWAASSSPRACAAGARCTARPGHRRHHRGLVDGDGHAGIARCMGWLLVQGRRAGLESSAAAGRCRCWLRSALTLAFTLAIRHRRR